MTTSKRPTPLAGWPGNGHFTAPCRAWFGPHWRPASEWGVNEFALSQRATAAREVQVAQGNMGEIRGLSKASDAIVARYRANNAKGMK